MDINDFMDSIFSVPSALSGLGGMLISLLAYKFSYLGKKGWLGNDCSVWVGIACVLLAMVLIALRLFWFIPCILLLPVVVLIARWYWLKSHLKDVLESKGKLDNDIVRYDYYLWLEKKQLYRWEARRFLFPAMNILFEIGAIQKLDDQLEKLYDYQEWYEWRCLKSYIHWNRHEYHELIALMTPYVENGMLKGTEYTRTVINIYGAYRILKDKEGVSVYIKKLEDIFFNQKKYRVEIIDDLMYYYDEVGDKEKIKQMIKVIKSLKFSDYGQLLDVYDVLYMYYRRHDDTEGNRKLLDFMVSQSSMITEEERKKLFEVRLLKLYFENDYGWRDYSIELFNQADEYLNYSAKVAFEYLRAVNLIVQNCRLHHQYPGPGFIQLYDKILNRIELYVEDFDRSLLELPDEFLYRKKEMLMLKEEYMKAKVNFRLELAGYLTELTNNQRKIISLCERNGDEREKLHFLIVLADDVIAFKDDIEMMQRATNKSPEEEKALSALSSEEVELAEIQAAECVQEINDSLKKHHYDRTMAYYIFYASYLNMKLENKAMAKQMLARFHATGIDIKHYTLAVQKLYDEVKKNL